MHTVLSLLLVPCAPAPDDLGDTACCSLSLPFFVQQEFQTQCSILGVIQQILSEGEQ